MNLITGVSDMAELAREASTRFETAHRNMDSREETAYIRIKDDSPQWLTDLTRTAHETRYGLMFPDDWRYACISATVDAIADGTEESDAATFADDHVDVYNSERLAWVGSHSYRTAYVDDAREDGLIGPDTDLLDAIAVGQYCEALEVFASVWQSLTERLDEIDA